MDNCRMVSPPWKKCIRPTDILTRWVLTTKSPTHELVERVAWNNFLSITISTELAGWTKFELHFRIDDYVTYNVQIYSSDVKHFRQQAGHVDDLRIIPAALLFLVAASVTRDCSAWMWFGLSPALQIIIGSGGRTNKKAEGEGEGACSKGVESRGLSFLQIFTTLASGRNPPHSR